VNELARELEISRRTVFRDLNMLELAHIPYYFDEQKGGYRINNHFFLPPVNLTLTEALAVLAMTGRLRQAKHLPLLSEGTRAAVKLESVLPPAVRHHVGSVLERTSVSLGATARHEGLDEMFDRLSDAISSHKVCRIVYLSFYDRRQLRLDIHPLHLSFHGRAWYVIAYSPRHAQVRTFKLGRIRKLTVTETAFEPPDDFPVDKHFGDAWNMIPEGRLYEVHLRFEPKVAGTVAEVQWHSSQKTQFNDDGSLDFHVRVDGLGEILWWILGYGDQVDVVGPEELRRKLGEISRRMVERYAREATA
jgi:proteasome accessory factor B